MVLVTIYKHPTGFETYHPNLFKYILTLFSHKIVINAVLVKYLNFKGLLFILVKLLELHYAYIYPVSVISVIQSCQDAIACSSTGSHGSFFLFCILT